MRTDPIPRRPGFTMVELLVVIAIIIVLAALSFTVIPGMRARALMAADMNKLRQISAALAGYASEHNNTLPNSNDPIPGTSTDPRYNPDRWNFHECVDRYLGPPDSKYNPGSVYNHLRRPDSPFYSRAARAYPGWTSASGYNQPGPIAFGFNPNINHGTQWRGRLLRIPRPGSTVVMAEYNRTGSWMDPGAKAVFEDNVETRYRVSRPGKTALYLFADYHVEALQGDRGYQYYESHPDETNIWRWW